MRDEQFSFGVVADIQYADTDAKHDRSGLLRDYRGSYEAFRNAVQYFNDNHGPTSGVPVQFIAQLGDFIDQKAKDYTELAKQRLSSVLESSAHDYWLHAIGNHDLYVFSRDELRSWPCQAPRCSYYVHKPASGWNVIVLDSFLLSVLGYPEGSAGHRNATEFLDQHSHASDTTTDEERRRQLIPSNGGLGEYQREWLSDQLQQIRARGERAILMSHVPVLAAAASAEDIMWDSDEVLQIINDHNDVVRAVFSGHFHVQSYTLHNGIHHVTLPSPLHAAGDDCFAVVHVYDDHLHIEGHGATVPSMDLTFLEPVGVVQ